MVKLGSGNYLKPTDIKTDDILVFVNEGVIRSIEGDEGEDKRIFTIGVNLPNGEMKDWTMNWTSQKVIIEKLTDDTTNWVGKKVKIFKQTQNVRGTLKDVIYAKEVVV